MFDMVYPGHYRRVIKSVRVTMPCVTGPYTNIGIKLTLGNSKIRYEAKSNSSSLKASNRNPIKSISTSNAQKAQVMSIQHLLQIYCH
jgi:Tc toxin complex TcA C-terminal TcB-binding domain